MEGGIRELIEAFFRSQGKKPSQLFLESACRYAIPRPHRAVDQDSLELLIRNRSHRAYLTYRGMRKDSTTNTLCYVLLGISDHTGMVLDDLRQNIKKGALGFPVSYFSDTKMGVLRNHVDLHIHGVMLQVYQNACIYNKLRKMGSFGSRAHMNFYEIVRKELAFYEKTVVEQEDEILSFYAGMYSAYIRLQIMHQINECFCDDPKRPFKFLSLHSGHHFYADLLRASFKHINECLAQFVSSGEFRDRTREFFIVQRAGANPWKSYDIDRGLVPDFVSPSTAEKILYIGKCSLLLKGISGKDLALPSEASVEEAAGLEIQDPRLDEKIEALLDGANSRIGSVVLEEMNINGRIEGIRETMLFGRCDFIETLFQHLKDTNKINKKSFSYILDMALKSTFGEFSGLFSNVGVYLVDGEGQYESFALFCHLDYPLSLIFTKAVSLKLVSVFQFLWKIKRIEHLLMRALRMEVGKRFGARLVSYSNVISKVNFYILEEVIAKKWRFVVGNRGLMLEELKERIEGALDEILALGWIDSHGRTLGRFLQSLETFLLSLGKGSKDHNDFDVQQSLMAVVEAAGDEFIGTCLFDLDKYVIQC
jgi:gamma-tubulin complex component 3